MENQNVNNQPGNPISPSDRSPSPFGNPAAPAQEFAPSGGEANYNQVPEPAKKESVDLRTMKSDIQSVKQSGGISPEPKQFNLDSSPFSAPASSAAPSQASAMGDLPPANPETASSGMNPGASVVPADNIPAPGNLPKSSNVVSEGEVFVPGSGQAVSAGAPASKMKKIGLIVATIILFAGLGYIGYSYVYPIFFPSTPITSNVNTPPVEESTPPVEEPVSTSIIHSPLINATSLGDVEFSGPIFKTSLIDLSQAALVATSTLAEFSVELNGAPMAFSDFFRFFFPDLNEGSLLNSFEPDFSGFIYFDADGESWPGYVAKLKPGVNLFAIQSDIRLLESASDFSPLFIAEQGEKNSAGFLDGQVDSIPTRYLTFSNAKAAIDYLWLGDYFVISTSYPGLKAVVPLLNP